MDIRAFTLLGLKLYGVIFENVSDTEIRISVPEFSSLLNKDGINMQGEKLAKRVKEILKDLKVDIKLLYRIRKGETWDEEKRKYQESILHEEVINNGGINTSLI